MISIQIYQLIILKVTALILLITAIAVFWYASETKKLREGTTKQTESLKQQNTFATLTTIHERMTNRISYEIRGYLQASFASDLVDVVKEVFKGDYITEVAEKDIVDINKVKKLPKNEKNLQDFNAELKKRKTSVKDVSALEAVEWTLLDFDLIAVPVWMQISSAEVVAEAYRPVLERTAKEIIPFVAIHQKLRGDKDYKKHYLYLLKELGISTQGLKVKGPKKIEYKNT